MAFESVFVMLKSSIMQDAVDAIKSFGYEQTRHILEDLEKKALNMENSFSNARNILDKIDGEKLVYNPSVRRWAGDVMRTIYDLEDLNADTSLKIRDRDDGGLSYFWEKWGLSRKMDRLQADMEALLRDPLLKEGSNLFPSDCIESRSYPCLVNFPNKSNFKRRQVMNEIIINLCYSTSTRVIISIQGEIGLGKTTLAFWVKNDGRINRCFEYKLWVNVSGEFNVSKVLSSIITQALGLKQIEGQLFENEELIKNTFTGKRVLVVLDDLCKIVNPHHWKEFERLLIHSTNSFGVLITTRSHQITNTITRYSTVPIVVKHLQLMSKEDCQSIILEKTLLPSSSTVAEKRKRCDQKEMALEISERSCKGSPLVASMIGLYLSSTGSNERWNNLRSVGDLWVMPAFGRQIIQAFRLDLSHLPRGLRNCFCYLSLFPINHKFNKKDLIRYWKAEGFIAQGMIRYCDHSPTALEDDMGDDWFEELSSRSILIHDPKLENYRVHEIIHHYATCVGCDICIQINDKFPYHYFSLRKATWWNKARHVALASPNLESSLLKDVEKCKGLRTLLTLNEQKKITQLSYSLFSKLHYLRVLNLSRTVISVLPGSIGNLKHLQLLDLSKTNIEELPASTTKLLGLQVLKLTGCYLIELPNDTKNLTNLVHLEADIKDMSGMPPNIGKLIKLQTLPAFIVGDMDGCRITELKDMKQLRGSICLKYLENVTGEEEVMLRDKLFIKRLELVWISYLDDPLQAERVLTQLEPHKGLEELQIVGYGGLRFPAWLSSAECRITTIHLLRCHNCQHLPALGQLPYLETLHIEEIHGVHTMDWGVSGFPLLLSLIIEDMEHLEMWESSTMHRLQDLRVVGCPKLCALPSLDRLTSLVSLEIRVCTTLHSLPEGRIPSSLKELIIEGSDLLKQRCLDENGADWNKIKSVPRVMIDFEQITM